MENRILKKTITLNGKMLLVLVIALICFATYGLSYLLEKTGKVDFKLPYEAFAFLGIISFMGAFFKLMDKMKYYSSEPGLIYYELIEIHDGK